MEVFIGGGGKNEYPKSGGNEVFEGGGRRDDRYVSKSTVISREDRRRQNPCPLLGATQYYSFLCPPGTGGRHTLVEAEEKRGVGANFEEVKGREDK